MADRSSIEWTQATWNPVTGCDRISPGCDHCYAATLARRLKAMGSAKYQRDGDPRTSGPGFAVTIHPAALTAPYRWRTPRLVFVNSMSDLFHARVPRTFVRDVFDVMAATPQHTYQVLTKRPRRTRRLADALPWPRNVWLGTTIETDAHVGRANDLRAVPAAVRFVSAEPLLGPLPSLSLAGLDWLIAGGESGLGARPMHPDWVRDLRDRCHAAGVAFFFKQWGAHRWTGADHGTAQRVSKKVAGRILDGRTWDDMPPTHPSRREPSFADQHRSTPNRREVRHDR